MTDKPFTITNIGKCPAKVIIITDIYAKHTYSNYIIVSFDNVVYKSLTDFRSNIFGMPKRAYLITVEPKASLYIKIDSEITNYKDKIIENILIQNSSVVLSGNINSLLPPVYLDPTVKLPKFAFSSLFFSNYKYCLKIDNAYNTSIVSAKGLEFPSLKLNAAVYDQTFKNCINLKYPPKILPAKIISEYAYSYMFEKCENLLEIPNIQATTFRQYSCIEMFSFCKKLKDISNFPRKIHTVYSNAFKEMFFECSSLKTLPSQIIIKRAHEYIGLKMFDGINKNYNYPLLSMEFNHIDKGAYFKLLPKEGLEKNKYKCLEKDNCKYPVSVFAKGRYIL